MNALAALVLAHLRAIEAQGYAAGTLATRRLHLQRFTDWCDARGLLTPDVLTPAMLERYQSWLSSRMQASGARLARTTQAHMLTSVRMLLA